MPEDLDLRLLRHFVAVAEELHFGRAADRLFVAQQALSRDVRRLEDRIGAALLRRTTRHVELTDAGRRLLPRAKEILAVHDLALRELREETPIVVDLVDPDLTPALVLAEVRRRSPEREFFGRFGGGSTAVPSADIMFGPPPNDVDVRSEAVRHEPLAVLIPEGHPFAALDAVPFERLRDERVCSRAGGHVTPGWIEVAGQLLEPFGIDPALGHPPVPGGAELARHVHLRSAPVLVLRSQLPVEGAVLRPLVDPIPIFPWHLSWRRDADRDAVRMFRAAAKALSEENGWLRIPEGAWLPRL
ncbi:LysR family transcriptional regulator [Microbacterium sp.]|uniref:LysR family transcriptional regulator n=1 Tax=Microbacterium sp. TaxID=51671 RepID=UPI00333FEDE9